MTLCVKASTRSYIWTAPFIMVVLLALSGWECLREPRYNHKTLSAWLSDFRGDSRARCAAAKAVKRIGPAGLPWIIKYLDWRESWWRAHIVNLAQALGRSNYHVVSITKLRRRYEALAACDSLGCEAAPAIPALERLLYADPPEPRAAYVLARIGPQSLVVLRRASLRGPPGIRAAANLCLSMFYSHSEALFPCGLKQHDFTRRIAGFDIERGWLSETEVLPHLAFTTNGLPKVSLPFRGPFERPGAN